MVFNQPIRSLDGDEKPQFLPAFVPPVAIKEVSYEGVAGLRVSFAAPLIASKQYTLRIPAGWRAATGALLSAPVERLWKAPSLKSPDEALKASPWDSLSPPAENSSDEVSPPIGPGASGALRVPQPWIGAGDPLVVVGLPYPGSGHSRGRLRLLDVEGDLLWSAQLHWRRDGTFVARVPAPRQLGRYRLEFLPDGQATPWRGEFWTCPTAQPKESYTLRLDSVEPSGRPSRAVLERGGPRHREVDLRAYLTRPRIGAEWERADLPNRSWLPLGWNQQEHLVFDPIDQDLAGVLVVEAVDRTDPELVLASVEQPIESTVRSLLWPGAVSTREDEMTRLLVLAPWLGSDGAEPIAVEGSLTFRGRNSNRWEPVARYEGSGSVSPWVLPLHRPGNYRLEVAATFAAPLNQESLNEVLTERFEHEVLPWSPAGFSWLGSQLDGSETSLKLERWDGIRTEVKAGDQTRLTGPSEAVVGWSPLLSGWSGAARSGRVPAGRPLIPWSGLKAGELGGWQLDRQGEVQLPAPSVAGTYRYWSVEPRSGEASELQVEIAERTRWTALVPLGVRPGDRFRAGPRFIPGPLKGPVGLTSSVGRRGLVPSGFVSTAGLAKGKETALLFDYTVPSDAMGPLSLYWQVGWAGRRQALSGEIPVWQALPSSKPPISEELRPWASRVYLERLAVDASGLPASRWSVEQGMALTVSLVNPRDGLSGQLQCPLPAGVEPLDLVALNSQAENVPWSFEQGVMSWQVSELGAGEALWRVELEAISQGDFLWPSARFTSPTGELWARSGSSRVTVEP